MSVETIFQVVQAFSPSFKSIDLRVVAVKPEDQWKNVIASVFLSNKSQKEVQSNQQQERDKLSSTGKFRILFACYPFKRLSNLFKQVEKGEVEINRGPITFRELNPFELRVDSFLPSYLKGMKEWKLIGSQTKANEENRKSVWSIIDDQNGHARLLGYKDIYELIRETLRIKEFDRGKPQDLVIGVPMPARIVNTSLVNSTVKVKIKKIVSLSDLQLNISSSRVKPHTQYYEIVSRTTDLVKGCKRSSTRNFCYVTNSIQFADLRPHDFIDVELIHRQVPTLRMDKTRLQAPLENAVEPFARTLNAFCSVEIFKERLLNPERCAEGRIRPNTIFENAVAWLLSLAGFCVLPLGKRFEKLKILETDYEVGSIDMIAYRENEYLLLIDCDTSIPDRKKIQSMTLVKKHLEPLQDKHQRPYIASIIFSPRECTGISVDPLAVKIIERHRIKRIFEEVMKGNLEQARSSLIY